MLKPLLIDTQGLNTSLLLCLRDAIYIPLTLSEVRLNQVFVRHGLVYLIAILISMLVLTNRNILNVLTLNVQTQGYTSCK